MVKLYFTMHNYWILNAYRPYTYFKCIICFPFTHMSFTCRNYTHKTTHIWQGQFIQRKITEIFYLGCKCGSMLENERGICTYKTHGMQKILLVMMSYDSIENKRKIIIRQEKSVTILKEETVKLNGDWGCHSA